MQKIKNFFRSLVINYDEIKDAELRKLMVLTSIFSAMLGFETIAGGLIVMFEQEFNKMFNNAILLSSLTVIITIPLFKYISRNTNALTASYLTGIEDANSGTLG